ncbi:MULTISPECIES: phospholipid carrier-dependent glycosyltransferase [Bradyrhizobium]|uniref:phospholipid carrier-dependent glycosyltransferase n=1 Tax=Bradyrhizobium TaxID=374 RepID=UPI00155E96EB|nr:MULTISPECIES: glycosyltransferase family 39 protein [Bradyrhizobium]MBR1171425.1 glycosyltransferase family 39 protein [Bradyrhizobium liaoningense]MDD1519302.1 dolichyl-phosphate-mannose--protein mannosyltransferase [Bradyrhizobium sp. WBAH30]MDD1543546.1 dolichyl-phosphate-mannose--protein mannosyltransferase [Bradyrhizobium sp. WBAH41]MDD1557676.1 dolichyl-phosphate-mannose--protein mannosyltransferase [Bradyrhizobium sp. WBAH23]MDD1565089.1 dolichyl-phosphate-mannose--protein mannosyltr
MPAVPAVSRSAVIAVAIFLIAHLALLIGVTTPEKFVFDEVHYVPAARQMLAPAMSQPMLNPMHPPLAKELIAASIATFGDSALGWRYPATLFGALAIVAIYLCGLALFAGQSPAIAAALIAAFNQMLYVQARIAMLDIFALGFGLLATAAFMHGFRRERPQALFAVAGSLFGLAAACKWSGLFPLGVCIVAVAVIRLMQGWHTLFADAKPDDWYRPELWPGLKLHHVALCFAVLPGMTYLAAFVPLYGLSLPDLIEAQRRIFADNTTTAIAGHTYMSAWPSWPLLARPVWFLFDKTAEDHVAAIVFLGNPLVLWPALLALAIVLRDFIVARRWDAFLIAAFYFGPWLAWALLPRTLGFIYYYLPAATAASLALVYAMRRDGLPRWLLWVYVGIAAAGFAVMLPISAAFVGTSMGSFNRLMLFQSWI